MNKSELVNGTHYAVRRSSSGTAIRALYVGAKRTKNRRPGQPMYAPHFKDDNGKEFWVTTCHRVTEWNQMPDVQKVFVGDVLEDAMKEASYVIMEQDLESMCFFLRTMDINAAINPIMTTDDEGNAIAEPVLFIKYTEALKMLELVRTMGFYDLMNETPADRIEGDHDYCNVD